MAENKPDENKPDENKPDEKQQDQPAAQPAATVQRQVVERTVVREVTEAPNGPGMTTNPEDPKAHYFEIADGEGGFRKVNAYGEEKGSPEDKKRMATY